MIPGNLTDPENNGQWAPVIDWPLIAIHAMVLPDGRVLSFGTNENGMQSGAFVYALWDYRTGTGVALEQTTATDIFCANMALDPYLGLTMIIGGDGEPIGQEAFGVNHVNAFDHRTETIAPSVFGNMTGSRWYPSVVTLGSGDLLTLGGRSNQIGGGAGDDTVEIYRSGLAWDTLDNLTPDIARNGKWWYPTTWLRSDGKVLMFEGTAANGGADYYLFDTQGEGTMTHLGVAPLRFGVQLPSISYRTDKGLMMDNQGRLWSVDFATDDVTFEVVGDVGDRRMDSDFTLLADGRVAITGGSFWRNDLSRADTALVIWDPETRALTRHENEDLARLYHSSTLLLPDGTLASMGGGAPGPLVNTNAQIWAPDYLFATGGTQAPRLVIDAAERPLRAGEGFILTVSDATGLDRITALKSGAATHSKNADARFVELDFTVLDDNTVEVILPANGNVLTPGTWMVFAFDTASVPSEAELIDVTPGNPIKPGVAGHYAHGTSTYQLGTPGLTWHEARAEAEAMGGRLLEIETPQENAFIHATFFRDNPIWLGINDIAQEGVYKTLDGFDPVFENWTDLRPYNRDDAHNFGIMTATDGTWRLAKDNPSPAYFEADNRASSEAAMTVIEFENTRELIVQTGDLRLRNTGDTWERVDFNAAMDDPVVIISPPTKAGGQPLTVRVRNVTETGFEVQLDEWEYLDGRHTFEQIDWMAAERGTHVLSDGAVIEAGIAMVGSDPAQIGFDAAFGAHPPVVLGQVASVNESDAVTERMSAIDHAGFTVRLQEQEANRNEGHLPETFHWVALEQGNHDGFSAFTGERVNETGLTLDLTRASAGDAFFADMQSELGADPATLRILARDDASLGIELQEEQSRNPEMAHAREFLGWVLTDEMIYV